ncbi:MAG: mercuric transporter MerT family protein [Gemmatimonadota bacterium]
MTRIIAAVAAGVAAAFGASLCCIGPLLAVFAGIGGAGLAATFEPLRPYLLVASGSLFVLGGVSLYRPTRQPTCGDAVTCEVRPSGRRKALFWTAVGVAAILASFPWWSRLLV